MNDLKAQPHAGGYHRAKAQTDKHQRLVALLALYGLVNRQPCRARFGDKKPPIPRACHLEPARQRLPLRNPAFHPYLRLYRVGGPSPRNIQVL
jgi:hypothetical protein